MAYLVYVLFNASNRIYIGQTDDRLSRHNLGFVRSSALHRPWKLLFTEEYDSRGVAMKREIELKKGQGRAYIRSVLGSSIDPPQADSSPRRGANNIPSSS